ncbi:putative endo-1,4-beta-xylanase [Rhexocercosporidium sp. MPI-PUGE-AT-0058]|nr:putative endo-1,4-beta-xylanase [Rhexocercosporidium sp. MPI-PUGE-AT-0058]
MYFPIVLSLLALPSAFGQLNKLAKAKGLKYFGSATDNPELSDAPYVAILSDVNEFGQITPGNAQKWSYTEPSQGIFSWSQADVVTNLAKANGQLLRCHTLVWHSQLPDWVAFGTWTNATLIAAMKNHIAKEVTYFKGKCYAWDVVNEAFEDDGTWRKSVFYNIIGPEFIPIAFATAAQYDPDVKLYYNDYNIESAGSKVTSALNLVKSLKARGIKIDGVGMQAHLIVGSTPSLSAQTSNLASFTALGVEVAYTELDIRFTSLPATASGLSQQSTDYATTVSACLATLNCVGITIWDYTDKYSWIPSVFDGQGAALLWDANLVKKPAYSAVVNVLGGSVTSTSTKAATSTSKPATVTTTTTAPTTTSTSVTVAKWGQCDGLTYSGSKTCVAGTVCTFQNDYYSQCL